MGLGFRVRQAETPDKALVTHGRADDSKPLRRLPIGRRSAAARGMRRRWKVGGETKLVADDALPHGNHEAAGSKDLRRGGFRGGAHQCEAVHTNLHEAFRDTNLYRVVFFFRPSLFFFTPSQQYSFYLCPQNSFF